MTDPNALADLLAEGRRLLAEMADDEVANSRYEARADACVYVINPGGDDWRATCDTRSIAAFIAWAANNMDALLAAAERVAALEEALADVIKALLETRRYP